MTAEETLAVLKEYLAKEYRYYETLSVLYAHREHNWTESNSLAVKATQNMGSLYYLATNLAHPEIMAKDVKENDYGLNELATPAELEQARKEYDDIFPAERRSKPIEEILGLNNGKHQ